MLVHSFSIMMSVSDTAAKTTRGRLPSPPPLAKHLLTYTDPRTHTHVQTHLQMSVKHLRYTFFGRGVGWQGGGVPEGRLEAYGVKKVAQNASQNAFWKIQQQTTTITMTTTVTAQRKNEPKPLVGSRFQISTLAPSHDLHNIISKHSLWSRHPSHHLHSPLAAVPRHALTNADIH